MASAHSATLCSPDALLHVSDLLHWQTLRCLSGLGLLYPENPVISRPALRRLPVFAPAFPGSTKKRNPFYSEEHSPALEFRLGVSNRPLKFLTSSVMQAGFIQCSLQSPRPAWPLLALLLCGIRQLRSRAVRVEWIFLQIRILRPTRPLLGPLLDAFVGFVLLP